MSIEEISVDDLADRLTDGARLIDVREPDEYAEARVPGAALVPLGSVLDRIDAFRGAGPAFVICRSGARSLKACEIAAQHGIEAINVAGGMLAWVATGRAVESGAA